LLAPAHLRSERAFALRERGLARRRGRVRARRVLGSPRALALPAAPLWRPRARMLGALPARRASALHLQRPARGCGRLPRPRRSPLQRRAGTRAAGAPGPPPRRSPSPAHVRLRLPAQELCILPPAVHAAQGLAKTRVTLTAILTQTAASALTHGARHPRAPKRANAALVPALRPRMPLVTTLHMYAGRTQ
jgi:hypothetical protein